MYHCNDLSGINGELRPGIVHRIDKDTNKWRELTEAIAYWTDLDHPYITLENNYIESVWNILATIHDKGLLYRGHRVSPYCPCCQTTLSSHEVAQGYEDVKDLSATAKFKLHDSGSREIGE